ncbi:quinone oxidoreductase family protein [Dactylosporangium fulvum]|uniref:NADPH:quinone oxidoreductase family protein n=1 Tax=Dactylosporangium fulvum TaxID=53359 RepID=A0ABY5W9P8_9ACTN|nr:NADPH:quinone oxidoreductase family protein [Dactylosporangium fulvum]UWP86797.1 NADPH:quinone oxidoreductase family protein [Dactylosporangium fulvum]
MELVDIARPEPAAGQVLLKVAAAGVNYADTRMRAGSYVRQPALPVTPGFEVSGTVEVVGPGAAACAMDPSILAAGTPVIAGDATGGYAQFAVVPADLLFPLPPGKRLEDAAALPVNYLVAWLALHHKGGLRPGETVLVHAAGGGVGSAITQLARLAGARVVATASSVEKLTVARTAGADVTVNYTETDFVSQIRDILGEQQPIDLVLDSVGGPTLVHSLKLLSPWGRLVGFGQASDTPASLDVYASAIPNHLDLRFFARGTLCGSRHPRDRALLYEAMQQVVALWASGDIDPVTVHRLPLSQASQAHRRLGDRSAIGKILLDPEA